MNVDCRWMDENLESLFCDRLPPEDEGQAHEHLETCIRCHDAVAELRGVDLLIKRLYHQNLTIARTPKPRRSPALAAAMATAMVVLIFVVIWKIPTAEVRGPQLQSPTSIASIPSADTPAVPKIGEISSPERAKPQPTTPDQPAVTISRATETPSNDPSAPDFLVTDPAGYARTLADYKGYVLIFGLWDPADSRAISNLEQIYKTFSSNVKLRILGVSNDRRPKPKTATFPIAYNQGSRLLGITQSQFIVVDGNGGVRLRGSLLDSNTKVLGAIRSTLSQIGVD
jgi:hypothetical protein